MSRHVLIVALVALGGGGYFAWKNYSLEVRSGSQGKLFEYVKLVPRANPGGDPPDEATPAPPAAGRSFIRIASFNLDGLDETKLANRGVGDALVRVLPHFDVIALQGVRAKNRGLLVRLVEQLNATGRSYDFASAPSGERDGVEPVAAIVFDRAGVEIDRGTVHLVGDPAGRFRHKPLVAAFRARGPGEAEAFTFTLIDVQVDPAGAAAELDLLAAVYRAVRNDGRNEDDIILLGDLEADPEHLGQLGRVPNLVAAISNVPTTTRGGRLADNILFDRLATVEFTGRAGVFDLRECDLSMAAALEISGHLPVWAEFSVYEGGQPGHVAMRSRARRQ